MVLGPVSLVKSEPSTKTFPSLSVASAERKMLVPNPVAKVLITPSGVILKIVAWILHESSALFVATKRLPALSKASPRGAARLEAKILRGPSGIYWGVYWKIELPPLPHVRPRLLVANRSPPWTGPLA